jgi:hypothetical protein
MSLKGKTASVTEGFRSAFTITSSDSFGGGNLMFG